MARLKKEFFERSTKVVARDLLGQIFCRKGPSGSVFKAVITETEAYLGVIDRAAHSYNHRRTPRTEVMYASPGTLYVYFIYGMYHCLNFVTAKEGVPEAVLLRGLKPLSETFEHDLTGPGKICKHLDIDKSFNGRTVWNSDIWIEERMPKRRKIEASPRIGLGHSAGEAKQWPLRFNLMEQH